MFPGNVSFSCQDLSQTLEYKWSVQNQQKKKMYRGETNLRNVADFKQVTYFNIIQYHLQFILFS